MRPNGDVPYFIQRINPQERAGELAVGSRVTIIAPRDPAMGGVRVIGIVVHPAKP